MVIRILINPELSVGTLIKRYLMRIDRPEIIARLDKGDKDIGFIHNARLLDINDSRKIKDVMLEQDTTITVNDIKSLIGA